MMRRLLMTIFVVGLASSLSIPVADAAGKKGGFFSVTETPTGNCTVTTAAQWGGHRILSVTFTLTVDTTPYSATESLKKAARSGALSHPFTVTNAGQATVHADFISPRKTIVGTADGTGPITVSCS